MQQVNILYIGRHPEIREIVVKLINKRENWAGIGVHSNEEAMELAVQISFDVILFGCGIDLESERLLCVLFARILPEAVIIQHYGGGGGLLYNEITAALHYSGKLMV